MKSIKRRERERESALLASHEIRIIFVLQYSCSPSHEFCDACVFLYSWDHTTERKDCICICTCRDILTSLTKYQILTPQKQISSFPQCSYFLFLKQEMFLVSSVFPTMVATAILVLCFVNVWIVATIFIISNSLQISHSLGKTLFGPTVAYSTKTCLFCHASVRPPSIHQIDLRWKRFVKLTAGGRYWKSKIEGDIILGKHIYSEDSRSCER